MQNVRVSIIMPTFNVGKWVGQAIETTLNQTWQNIELCIYDDASSDNTVDVIRSYMSDARIKLDVGKINRGAPSGYNGALALATGEIIARLDSDDWHELSRIEKQAKFLIATTYDLVSCRMRYHYANRVVDPPNAGMQPAYTTGDPRYGPMNASIVAWRYVYDIVGGFDPKCTASPDGDWNFRALSHNYKWGFINEVLYHYRRHPNQVTERCRAQQRKEHEEAWRRYQ